MKFALVLLVCLISIFSSSHAIIQRRTNSHFTIYLDDDTGLFTVSGKNDIGVELPILFGADQIDPIPLSSYITIHSSASNTLYITGVHNADPNSNSIDPLALAEYLGTPTFLHPTDTDRFTLHYAPTSGEFTADVTIALVSPSGSNTLESQIQPSVVIKTEVTNLLATETTFTVNYVLDYTIDTDGGPTFRELSEASSRQRYAQVINDPKFDYYIMEANFPVQQKYTVVGSVNVPARYLEEIERNDFTKSQNETSSTIHDVYGYLYTVVPKVLVYTSYKNAYHLNWALTTVTDSWGNDHEFIVSVAQGLEYTHRGLYDPTALPEDSVVLHSWAFKLKSGESDVAQTSFFVNLGIDHYVGNQVTQSCTDGFACTWDYFVDVDCYDSECINLPIHKYCNDDNPCTIDLCDQSSGYEYDQDGCVHIEKNCDDEIPCTRDYCDPFTGNCVHDKTPSGFAISCEDQNPCTKDYCEEGNLGKCINEPNDDLCNTTIDKCNTHYCDERPYVGGCRTRPVNCNDDIMCTDDTCNPATGCSNIPNAVHCDDNIDCTTDVCDVALGKCVNYPTNTLCDDQNLCTTDYCDVLLGCVHIPMECHKTEISCTLDYCVSGYCIHVADDAQCDDNVTCTSNHCNLHLSECTIKPDDDRCDDGLFCTDDYCDVVKGCQTRPHVCDDDIPCTQDRCDSTLDECVYDTSNQAVTCDDAVDCTTDVCDTTLGQCVHIPSNTTCEDDDPCTSDYCDPYRGCMHVRKYCNDQNACTIDMCIDGTCVYTSNTTASSDFCDDQVSCTDDRCDSKVGCIHVPLDFRCNDNIACTDDKCTGAGCTNTPNDFNCDDQIACTIDTCDARLGCIHTPVNEICNDYLNSTIDTCDSFIGCVFTLDASACVSKTCAISVPTYAGCKTEFRDDLCNDNIDCTDDYCGPDGECVHEPRHSQCCDNVGCTDDVCSTNATVGLGCVHISNAAHCSDGRECTKEICDEQYGCIIEYTALCPKDTGDEHCMNCRSPRSRLGLTDYDDGTVDFRIQTRLEAVVPFSTVSPYEGLTENMLIKSWGAVVFGQEEYLEYSPAVVIGANSGLRLVPIADTLPHCNEIARGMIIVKESMDSTGSVADAMFVCLHEGGSYSWAQYV